MYHPTAATMSANESRPPRARPGGSRRRGVSSVLAMMFLVIFGSLAAAMAVVAQGNLRTADSAMKVSRAMSAAETGLVFAQRRLASESRRFVVEKGDIDSDFGHDIWMGTYDPATDGDVEVLPPVGYDETGLPMGVMEAIFNAHLADSHWIIIEPGDNDLPEIDTDFGTILVRPIALTSNEDGTPNADGPYFRLKYELIDNAPYVRVTSEGVDGNITRTLQMDFQINKKIEFAVISPNRIMIGKNVRVEGPLGTRFGLVPGEMDSEHGDPLVMRSDFYYLDPALDAKLDVFFEQIVQYDVDGDGRLRIYHPTESIGAEASPDLEDHDGNEYVDDFDLFLAHYDTGPLDYKVVYDTDLANEVHGGNPPEEFSAIDDQLARLIDYASPDRDGNGFPDEPSDRLLGYRDGIIDGNDLYAKVRGRLSFAIAREDWENAHGESYQTVVRGPIHPGLDHPAVTFEATDEQLREVTTDMFNDSASWFAAKAAPTFQDQVDAQGGHIPPSDETWEASPYNAQGAYDWYQRPIYEYMTFENIRIPMGNNGLFVNCTFEGVTYIETEPDCTHENWNYVGALERVEVPDTDPQEYVYEPKYPGLTAFLGVDELTDTKPYSNNLRFSDCTFIGSISGIKPDEYAHWRNKLQLTGETRFYIDPDDPDLDAQPDANDIRDVINGMPLEDLEELAKSSILVPGWSADIGNFTNEQNADPLLTPKVKLKGTIVAGILDVRGTADVFGTLLMTFRPVEDEGPLYYGGLTDAFNTTVGYFGPSDGDGEGVDPDEAQFMGFGEITLRYDNDARLPDGIPWPIGIEADPVTYVEGGSM